MPGVPRGEALAVLAEITDQVAPAGFSIDYQGQSRQLVQEGSSLML
ncbi:MAG: hypothetical protein ACI9J2_002325, partial [Saprospiraceae bacterium]